MPQKKVKRVTPNFKKNVSKIVPPGVGLKRVASKALGRAIPKAVKVAGQLKKVKVKNPLGIRQVPRKTRKVKFKITRR